MYLRSVYSLTISLVVTLLHIGCCVLPLLSIATFSVNHTGFLAKNQKELMALQLLVLAWLTIRLTVFYLFGKGFHGRLEKASYHIGWVIALSGLLINRLEPFKTEKQILAEQHFERFKSNRQLTLELEGGFNTEQLRNELENIPGVRKSSISIENGTIVLSFRQDQITSAEIITRLEEKGYRMK